MGFSVSGSLVIPGAGGQGQQPGACRVHLQLSRRAQQRRLGGRFPYELHKHRHLAMDNPAWRLQGLSNARCFGCSSVPMRTTKMFCCSAPQVQALTSHSLCRRGRVVQGIGQAGSAVFPCKKSPYGVRGILVRRRRSPKRRTETLRTFRLIGSADHVVEKPKMQIRTPSTGLPCRFQVVRRF